MPFPDVFNINHIFAFNTKTMKAGEKKIVLVLISILCLWISGSAQDSNPLKFLPGVSQSSFYNPAQQNETEKLVLGLPFISGTSFNWKSNFAIDYIFYGNFSYSFDRFYHELGEPGDAFATVTIPMVYLSWRKEQHNFTFSIQEKIVSSAFFDHELLQFIDLGIQPYYGNNKNYGPVPNIS